MSRVLRTVPESWGLHRGGLPASLAGWPSIASHAAGDSCVSLRFRAPGSGAGLGAPGNLLRRSSWWCGALAAPAVRWEGPEGPRLPASNVGLRGTPALCEVHGRMARLHAGIPAHGQDEAFEGLPRREQAGTHLHVCLRPQCRGWRPCWRRGSQGPLLPGGSWPTTAASGVIGTPPHSRKHPRKPWDPGGGA